MKYNKSNTRNKLIRAGLELFHTQGYEETTISQILEKSNTSRSAFYHHFRGKEELLFSIAYTMDDDYELWYKENAANDNTLDLLLSFLIFSFECVEASPYRDLYQSLYGLQVTTIGVRPIIDPNRSYSRIILDILKKGQERGEIKTDCSYFELTRMIISYHIGITYSWCLQKEMFSLPDYARKFFKPFLDSIAK